MTFSAPPLLSSLDVHFRVGGGISWKEQADVISPPPSFLCSWLEGGCCVYKLLFCSNMAFARFQKHDLSSGVIRQVFQTLMWVLKLDNDPKSDRRAAGASVFSARVVIVLGFFFPSDHISSLMFNYYYAHELLVEFWKKKKIFHTVTFLLLNSWKRHYCHRHCFTYPGARTSIANYLRFKSALGVGRALVVIGWHPYEHKSKKPLA